MIIDFHTHIFPDQIAEKTIKYLSEKGNVKVYGKATLGALKEDMRKNGIDKSVILPVATKASQVESINRLAAEHNGEEGIIYFGALHPECENVEEILDGIKAAGLRGIKIHPDYQHTNFDSPEYLRIMEEAAKRDLLVVTHAGLDIGFPKIHCTPDMILNVLEKLDGIIDNKLILAHMGGCDLPDEVIEKLAGKPVYFDTSFVLDRYTEKCREVILAHGIDRVLFATDYPWSDGKKFVEIMKSYGFSQEDTEKVFHENAEKLLALSL